MARKRQILKPPLTPKMERLIEAFDVEAEDWDAEFLRAGKQVGYAAGYVKKKLKNNRTIIRKLKHREEYGMSEEERNRRIRKEFWQTVMQSELVEMKDRLKASQLWGKAEGDFVHKVEASVKVAKDLEEKLTEALEEDAGGSD